MQLHVLVQLPLQRLDRLLEVLALPRVLRGNVRVDGARDDGLGHVPVVHFLHGVLESLGLLDVLHRFVQLRPQTAHLCVLVTKLGSLRLNLALHALQLEALVGDRQLEGRVVLVVPLELLIHVLDLLFHLHDLDLARLDLLLELLDLVVEHELELLELLVLLLQVVDAFLLVADGLIALPDLLFEARDVLFERANVLVQRLLVLEQPVDLVLLVFDVLL
mmetsp:Transcript_12088/g.20634  ORF Transcript_12088/g.20634 Transcript_12088/m.20634 type:complete len:219 (-) Transcript_12088:1142-1798(-)